jgi:hypothetical protein
MAGMVSRQEWIENRIKGNPLTVSVALSLILLLEYGVPTCSKEGGGYWSCERQMETKDALEALTS